MNQRLDVILTERGLCTSREQAQRCILAGEVWQGTARLDKPGLKLACDAPIELKPRTKVFASRAGFKLEHGLQKFGISVQDRVCLDVGASTGGFTDCLLKRGARRVFAVDVGTGQLDQKLREHSRVVSIERTNARFLTAELLRDRHEEAGKISFVCADVSFISLRLLIEPVTAAAPEAKDWVLLFKPQFEVGPEHVGKGGLVRNAASIESALTAFNEFMEKAGFVRRAVDASPVPGKKSGNTEILLHYEKA